VPISCIWIIADVLVLLRELPVLHADIQFVDDDATLRILEETEYLKLAVMTPFETPEPASNVVLA
jgi:hypothetical protein